MARRKETIWQSDFSQGSVRPEAVERDDTELVLSSVAEAKNTITLSTGQIEARPGLVYENETGASYGFEVDLGERFDESLRYDVLITPSGLSVYKDGDDGDSFNVDWTTLSGLNYSYSDIDFWVAASPRDKSILVGSKYFPIQVFYSFAGLWFRNQADYATSATGTKLPPYFKPNVNCKMAVSDGTVQCDTFFFRQNHVGSMIRVSGFAMEITSVDSSTEVTVTQRDGFARSIELTVSDADGFRVGQVIEHENLGGNAEVTEISGNIIRAVVIGRFANFNNQGRLIGPSAVSDITAYSEYTATPQYISDWDIQMFSDQYGYPAWGTIYNSRLFLCDFDASPDLFAASVVGDLLNFRDGAGDDDGMVESVGRATGGALRYIIGTEDLLFFTTRGLYYQQSRDGSALTPQTVNIRSFSQFGCAAVRPLAIDDGAIFVDDVGQQIHAAVLSGDIYRSWKVENLTRYHSHLIKDPVSIGGTVWGSERPESFLFVVNADGTAAACQWDRASNALSWRQWDTDGKFVGIYQARSRIRAIVDRTIAGQSKRFRERFEFGVNVDCGQVVKVETGSLQGIEGQEFFGGVTSFAPHLSGHEASVWFENWDYGDLLIDANGQPQENGVTLTYEDFEGYAHVGLNFEAVVAPWPRRSIQTQRGTRYVKRVLDFYVTVQDTGRFSINDHEFNSYRVDDPTGEPPRLVTEQFRMAVPGGDGFKQNVIKKARPGPFRILRIGQRVVA